MTGLYDNHNHSQFSFDGGRTSVGKTVNSAIGKGLAGVCFTDHCDFFVPPMKAQYEEYVSEVFDVEASIIAKTKCAKIENETSKTYLFFASQFSATLSNV